MQNLETKEEINFIAEFRRFISFWPYILVFVISSISIAYLYLRYAEYTYTAEAKIQVLDKAQDSEMALPTAMTIFNRSMINLKNETGILKSFSIHNRVVKNLNANIKYYTLGRIKTTENHSSEWHDDFYLDFKDNFENNHDHPMIFDFLNFSSEGFSINFYKSDQINNTYYFEGLTTREVDHDLPFNVTFKSVPVDDKKIIIYPLQDVAQNFRNSIEIISDNERSGSDQLIIKLSHPNPLVAEEYINKLIYEFDQDGIKDRQLEYKRTINFVDSRSTFLESELEQIEIKKSNFKRDNKLTNIESDATSFIQEQLTYDNELFSVTSQKDLSILLYESIDGTQYEYLPVNIGFENTNINLLIEEYNSLINERELILISAGPNNPMLKNIESKLNDYLQTILTSIKNFQENIDKKIENIKEKENEFANYYKQVPENEKILRSIERELSIKEALFLLLLQKREEASINYAVIKPSIKIIDSAISTEFPISPNKFSVYIISFAFGLFFPIVALYIWFVLDTKIHTKEQLLRYMEDSIPTIGEIPYVRESEQLNSFFGPNSRNPLAESIRVVTSNLKFHQSTINKNEGCLITLVTSSIKGEGKTLISSNLASVLSHNSNQKVLLIGADLRNPQIHKLLSLDKTSKGLSDIIYKKDLENFKNYVIKNGNLDILLSGTIPPNPSELLSSDYFKDLIEFLKQQYDQIVIDSAPCLLVSDTFAISAMADSTLYIFRSNYSEKNLTEFINDNHKTKKLKSIQLVLNSVGNSSSYGYKYGYQYGYQYGYKYSYNYGYGYGYNEDQ